MENFGKFFEIPQNCVHQNSRNDLNFPKIFQKLHSLKFPLTPPVSKPPRLTMLDPVTRTILTCLISTTQLWLMWSFFLQLLLKRLLTFKGWMWSSHGFVISSKSTLLKTQSHILYVLGYRDHGIIGI